MLRCQFLCYVLKTLFSIKIALKLSYFCKKMQNFRALGALPPDPRSSDGWGLCPQTPSLRQLGASPSDPQISPPLRISGYAPVPIRSEAPKHKLVLYVLDGSVYLDRLAHCVVCGCSDHVSTNHR